MEKSTHIMGNYVFMDFGVCTLDTQGLDHYPMVLGQDKSCRVFKKQAAEIAAEQVRKLRVWGVRYGNIA